MSLSSLGRDTPMLRTGSRVLLTECTRRQVPRGRAAPSPSRPCSATIAAFNLSAPLPCTAEFTAARSSADLPPADGVM